MGVGPRVVSVKPGSYLSSNEQIKASYAPHWKKQERKRAVHRKKVSSKKSGGLLFNFQKFVASDTGKRLQEGTGRVSSMLR